MKRVSALLLAGLLAGCITPPPAPPAPYSARGSQPNWSLIIDNQHVTYIRADQSVLREPTPQPVITAAGSTYQSPRIRVTITHAQCRDGVSDRVYPDRVRVDVDGRAFNGCGGL
ncbi:hypothetical protein [Sphingomonas sp.]|uniref:hypothetical protein n=1 Tax=Sphingomonas sp. TaxID=28214 RepID=UPI001835B0E4|nr:hypothetical protein [Sphingomonas sp.]MBA3512081.1 hypothetical protein [Sphingomonas sp.]